MIIDLRKQDLRKVEIGTRVVTSKGFMWELKARDDDKETWLDETSGLTWHNPKVSRINHYQAQEKFGNKLPMKEEYEVAESHGIREVMDLANRWYWSASVHPSYADGVYYFNGNDGYTGYGNRSISYYSDAALCVSRE